MLGFGRESPPVQAYGKLPLAKDYLRVGAGDDGGRELREWMDQAFSGQAIADVPPELAWPMRFVFVPARGETLLGTAWPSADSGGLRRFPFALFVERRRRALADAATRGFRSEDPWWRALEAYHGARANFADGQAYLGALRGQSIDGSSPGSPSAGDDAEDEAHVPWRLWLEALTPGDPEAGMGRMLRGLLAAARDASRGAVRLPLVGNLPLFEQIEAWIKALREIDWSPRGELATCFFPRENDDREPLYLVAFRRPLTVRDVAWLSRPGRAIDPGDLVDERPRVAAQATLAPGPALAESIHGALVSARARA